VVRDTTGVTAASYALVDAPWGPIHVAATDAGIVALEVMTPTDAFLEGLSRRGLEPTSERAGSTNRHDVLARAIVELEAYLRGEPRPLDLSIDLGPRRAWDRDVLGGVRGVPWGRVSTYGRIARRIGRPGAARAVGGAVGRNPIGLFIPCHRVIAGDGTIGGYGGAWYGTREAMLAVKRELLAIEGIELPARTFEE
jgi:methylated-DNA-[protein]-cysteine S-methyltransferase